MEDKKKSFLNYFNEDSPNFIVEYRGNFKEEIDRINYGCGDEITKNIGVVSTAYENIERLKKDVPSIIFIEIRAPYVLQEMAPNDIEGVVEIKRNPYLGLRGSGVLIGIVDTGIDYLNNEFMREDETTRILSIWDQTIDSGKTPDGFISGSEYTEEDINKAIQAQKQGKNPYDIVPSKDDYGHGTKMAGIVGARGINREIVGVAPDCEFIIIKLQEASKEYIDFYYAKGDKAKYRNTDIIMALKYLYELSFTLNKPMIIYLPLGSNLGDHAGASILERYVDTKISGRNSLFVVTSTGNQGNTDTHTSGEIKSNGDSQIIELNCGKEQQGLVLQIYAQRPSKIKLGILSPSGEIFENTNPRKTKHILINDAPTWKFIYEGTTVQVTYDSPDEFTGDDKFVIKMEGITEGVWRFILTGNNIVDGKYYAWILQRELLAEDTRFLNPSPYTTLTIPGTAKTIINTSYYNQNNGAIVSESGRGYTMKDYIQPIITAGGINAITTKPGGGTITMSGASVAGAILAGCCALIIQWAVVDGNDPQMYATKLQAYIIRGARKREGDTYPNRQWGYGILDMQEIFKSLTNK